MYELAYRFRAGLPQKFTLWRYVWGKSIRLWSSKLRFKIQEGLISFQPYTVQ